MAAVADAVGLHLRREGRAVVVMLADGADRAAYEHRGVGGVDRGLGRNGQLELSGGVLGMKLLDLDPLRAQCRDEITGIVRYANQAGHAVRRTDRRRNEIVSVASGYHPLDLEGSLDLQPLGGRILD